VRLLIGGREQQAADVIIATAAPMPTAKRASHQSRSCGVRPLIGTSSQERHLADPMPKKRGVRLVD
jgi:hypothetical protein